MQNLVSLSIQNANRPLMISLNQKRQLLATTSSENNTQITYIPIALQLFQCFLPYFNTMHYWELAEARKSTLNK